MQKLIPIAVILFLIGLSYSQDTTCFPKCRTGYICHKGVCVTMCNPPCPLGQTCTEKGECVSTAVSEALKDTGKENKIDTPQIECAPLFTVCPDFSTINRKDNYNKEEILDANTTVGAIIINVYTKAKLIDATEFKYIGKCNSKAIVAKVENYYREISVRGQYVGVLKISLSFYQNSNDLKPVRVEEYTAKGKRHWGYSEPLKNAINEVCRKIRQDEKD